MFIFLNFPACIASARRLKEKLESFVIINALNLAFPCSKAKGVKKASKKDNYSVFPCELAVDKACKSTSINYSSKRRLGNFFPFRWLTCRVDSELLRIFVGTATCGRKTVFIPPRAFVYIRKWMGKVC